MSFIDFKEELHPRGSKGSARGGQFVSKGGSGSTVGRVKASSAKVAKPRHPLSTSDQKELAKYTETSIAKESIDNQIALKDYEVKGIKGYAGTGNSMEINYNLRKKLGLTPSQQNVVNQLDRLAERGALTKDALLYRYVNLWETGRITKPEYTDWFKNLKPGTVLIDPAFCSTTMKKKAGKNAVQVDTGKNGMKIMAPKGSRGIAVPISITRGVIDENEFIIARGSRLTYIGDDPRDGYKVFKLRQDALQIDHLKIPQADIRDGPMPTQSVIAVANNYANTEVEVLINPTRGDVRSLGKLATESEGLHIRVLRDNHRNIYVWNAADAIHIDMIKSPTFTGKVTFAPDETWYDNHYGLNYYVRKDGVIAPGPDGSMDQQDFKIWIQDGQNNAKQAGKLEKSDVKLTAKKKYRRATSDETLILRDTSVFGEDGYYIKERLRPALLMVTNKGKHKAGDVVVGQRGQWHVAVARSYKLVSKIADDNMTNELYRRGFVDPDTEVFYLADDAGIDGSELHPDGMSQRNWEKLQEGNRWQMDIRLEQDDTLDKLNIKIGPDVSVDKALEPFAKAGFNAVQLNKLPPLMLLQLTMGDTNLREPIKISELHALSGKAFASALDDLKGTKLEELKDHIKDVSVVYADYEPKNAAMTTVSGGGQAAFMINTACDYAETFTSPNSIISYASRIANEEFKKTGDLKKAIMTQAHWSAVHEFVHLADAASGGEITKGLTSALVSEVGVDSVKKMTAWLKKNISPYALHSPKEAAAEVISKYIREGKLPGKSVSAWADQVIGRKSSEVRRQKAA